MWRYIWRLLTGSALCLESGGSPARRLGLLNGILLLGFAGWSAAFSWFAMKNHTTGSFASLPWIAVWCCLHILPIAAFVYLWEAWLVALSRLALRWPNEEHRWLILHLMSPFLPLALALYPILASMAMVAYYDFEWGIWLKFAPFSMAALAALLTVRSIARFERRLAAERVNWGKRMRILGVNVGAAFGSAAMCIWAYSLVDVAQRLAYPGLYR